MILTKRILPFLFALSAAYADNPGVRDGFTLYTGVSNGSGVLRISMPLRLVEEENYAGYPDALSLTAMLIEKKPKIGMGFLAQWALLITGFAIPPDIAMKLQYPFWLANFRVQGNVTRHSFVYFKQMSDLFTDGIYSESSMGVGLAIHEFEVYGGGAKALLDPFGLPNEITWRMGVSKWL